MRIVLHQFDLPLRHVFTISRESIDVQPTLIVELQANGCSGFGEATANHYYGVTIESMATAIRSVADVIQSHSPSEPESLWESLQPDLADNPFALCAIDQAAHDLWGKLEGAPVYELWGLTTDKIPPSNYTIGIDEIDKMVAKLNEMPGWPVYKIKLGTDRDLSIVRRLREHTSATFRVDANCGWSAEETIRNSQSLKDLDVEFIEQPLPSGQWDEQNRVYEQSALPVIADESCIEPRDVGKCHGHFHGINIKLVKCGGLTPARRMVQQARFLGMKVMVGCMTESTVGISAIAQLLPLLDYVDMDGAALLAEDIATGVVVDHGQCQYPAENGTGAMLLKSNVLS